MRHRQTTDSLELPASTLPLRSSPGGATARMAAMTDAGVTPTVGTSSGEGAGGLGTDRPARPRGTQDSALGTASVSEVLGTASVSESTGDAACADPVDATGTGALRWSDALCGPAQSRAASSNPHNTTATRQRYQGDPGKRAGRTWRWNGNSSSAGATAPDAERGGAVDRDRQGRVQRPGRPRTSVLNQRIREFRGAANRRHRAGPGVWRAYADRTAAPGARARAPKSAAPRGRRSLSTHVRPKPTGPGRSSPMARPREPTPG